VLPSHIASKPAFENAIALDIAMCGSTNTVLHILAAAPPRVASDEELRVRVSSFGSRWKTSRASRCRRDGARDPLLWFRRARLTHQARASTSRPGVLRGGAHTVHVQIAGTSPAHARRSRGARRASVNALDLDLRRTTLSAPRGLGARNAASSVRRSNPRSTHALAVRRRARRPARSRHPSCDDQLRWRPLPQIRNRARAR